MSRSKRDILETEKMLERLALTLGIHAGAKDRTLIEYRTDAEALRRISMTLRTWHELECGTDRGHIERDEKTGVPRFYNARARYLDPKDPRACRVVPDREAGALKRLKRIMSHYPALQAYVQTDPRGCALYILRPGDVPQGDDVSAYYSRGLAVFK